MSNQFDPKNKFQFDRLASNEIGYSIDANSMLNEFEDMGLDKGEIEYLSRPFIRPSKSIDLSDIFSVINPKSTFDFIRKKSRNTQDNFDYIKEFHSEGRHLKMTAKVTPTVLENLSLLRASFPNFSEVIDNITNQLTLKMIGNRRVKIEPMYLHGDPGIGKTEFIYELSKTLSVPLEKINVAILTGSFSLAGSESQWADSAPGMLVKSIIKHPVANFIFYLDELEKVNTLSNGGNPINALFDLLEESSAQQFVDLAFGDSVMFDTTAINFMASGNSLQGVHPAILSRFNVFKIPAPDTAQMQSIVRNIHKSLLKNNDWGNYFDPNLSNEVVEMIVDEEGSIRQVKKILKNAYVRAYKQGRNQLKCDDIMLEQNSKPMRIGF